MRTCKYPNKECTDRYLSTRNNYGTPICRLDEWKRKIGVCSYNKEIHSTFKTKKMKKDNNQTKLE